MRPRISAWAPLLDTRNVNHGLLLPFLMHCAGDQGRPLLGPTSKGRQIEQFLRNAHSGIPVAVEAMRQYWMPIRYPAPADYYCLRGCSCRLRSIHEACTDDPSSRENRPSPHKPPAYRERRSWVLCALRGKFRTHDAPPGGRAGPASGGRRSGGLPDLRAGYCLGGLAIAKKVVGEGWNPKFAGVTHLAGPDALTWCAFANDIVRGAALRGGRLVPVSPIATCDHPKPATRPANSRLWTARLASLRPPATAGMFTGGMSQSFSEKLNRRIIFESIILAGGSGTRLYP
jgi:hypothetical protein